MRATEVVELLSQETIEALNLKTPARDERIIFKTLKPSVKAFNTAGDQVFVNAPSLRIPNKDVVFLPNKEGDIQEFQIEFPNEIVFDGMSNAMIEISGTEVHRKELLYFLRMTNRNNSNIYKKLSNGATPLFQEEAQQLSAIQTLKEEKRKSEIISAISAMNFQQVESAYSKLGLFGHTSNEEKQLALIDIIKTKEGRSKFEAMVYKQEDFIKELVKKSLEAEYIVMDEETKTFSLATVVDGMAKKSKDLFTPALGQEPVSAFCKYLKNDPSGKKEYEVLDKLVNGIQQKRREKIN